ncbi:MAG TPA: tetratricopeptide repeat protein [Campylobacterales bacterium]|nr:tetratricopeptide repeat protein [Campylobacterales bacterium]HHD80099.1 tetratricopeptide repeat protein [Campylobacterales bacterium]HHH50860.1 tetratricopeptide repeat protein [Campylobacterales bacterium]
MIKIKHLPLILALSVIPLSAKKQEAPTVNYYSLATLMIMDGKYDKAMKELDEIDENSPTFDGSKYYTMRGVISLKKSDYFEAIKWLNKAVEATKTKVYLPPKSKEEIEKEKEKKHLIDFILPEEKKPKKKEVVYPPDFHPEKMREEKIEQLYMYLSKAYYKSKDYENTVRALDLAGIKGSSKPALYTLRGECYWKLKEHNEAINALNRGLEIFPSDKTLLKQKFYYYRDLKLYRTAIEAYKRYLEVADASPNEYLALAQMLVSGNQIDLAIKVLEEARLDFPDAPKLSMFLGQLYMKKDMVHVSAQLFETASYYDSNYTKDAAEMTRRAKELPHALYLNAGVTDKAEKIKQKIAILVDREEFEKVIGLKDALRRYNMLSDDNLRYALAYAYYMVKDYDNAEKNFKKITDNGLFSKATLIRKNIEKCKNNSLECL